MGTTDIEYRLRGMIERLAPNQTKRYDLLAASTGIARHKWVNWLNDRQGLSLEMLEAYTRAWPEHAIWVATGQGMPPQLQKERIHRVVLTRDKKGIAVTNVPHVVSRHHKGTPPEFEWGYVGSGPRELAMNILYHFGLEEPEADYFSKHFADQVLGRIDREKGGELTESAIAKWMDSMASEIRKQCDKRRAYEELRAKHEAELQAKMAALDRRTK